MTSLRLEIDPLHLFFLTIKRECLKKDQTCLKINKHTYKPYKCLCSAESATSIYISLKTEKKLFLTIKSNVKIILWKNIFFRHVKLIGIFMYKAKRITCALFIPILSPSFKSFTGNPKIQTKHKICFREETAPSFLLFSFRFYINSYIYTIVTCGRYLRDQPMNSHFTLTITIHS